MSDDFTPTPRDTKGKPKSKRKAPTKNAQPWSIDDFLADYRPLEKVVPITMRGDLIGRLTELEERLAAARDASDDGGLGDGSEAIAVAREIGDLREQVRDTSRPFRVVSIGDRAWSDIIAKHPPDKDSRKEGLPWNPETFYADALSASIAEPQMSPEQADKLLETLSAGQIRKLVGALLEVNGGGDDVPKSDASFVLRQASEPKQSTSSREVSLDLSSLDGL